MQQVNVAGRMVIGEFFFQPLTGNATSVQCIPGLIDEFLDASMRPGADENPAKADVET